MGKLAEFKTDLGNGDTIAKLRDGLIGEGMAFDTPFGTRQLLYADYVASGRALRQVEDFVLNHVLPYYANSHTEASFCGGLMTRLREDARAVIASSVGVGSDSHVIFTGSGTTSGINRIINLLEVKERVVAGERITIVLGPYEHHSNLLPWRDTGAQIVEITEAAKGGPCVEELKSVLKQAQGSNLIVGSFSAASNVSGVLTDTHTVTKILKAHGALSIWDYAAGAPYLPMTMGNHDSGKDAIVFSPHKFPGGPGATGIMVIRDTIVRRRTPTWPGGGSVSFVSPWAHHYSDRIEAREEAGTPNVIGDIRAALAMLVKEAVGTDRIVARERELRERALRAWKEVPQLELLGQRSGSEALPIFSFRVRASDGRMVHHQLFTRMLSDIFGVQARGGCACAGSYAHRLLGLDREASDALFERLRDGEETEKPGWVRLNLSYLHSDSQADAIIGAVAQLAGIAESLSCKYQVDTGSARFTPIEGPKDILTGAHRISIS